MGVVLFLSGCQHGAGNEGTSGAPAGTKVAVTLTEYAIQLSDGSVPSGHVTFDVRNAGHEKHEVVILKTDIQSTALPLGADGMVPENATGITHVDEIEGLDSGRERSLAINLAAGSYVLICNLPGHVRKGMVAQLTVR
ncbi:MAG TPA: sulfocyanin-like copper-binding protein [Candidatus Dormibacteraeota bacterium]